MQPDVGCSRLFRNVNFCDFCFLKAMQGLRAEAIGQLYDKSCWKYWGVPK